MHLIRQVSDMYGIYKKYKMAKKLEPVSVRNYCI